LVLLIGSSYGDNFWVIGGVGGTTAIVVSGCGDNGDALVVGVLDSVLECARGVGASKAEVDNFGIVVGGPDEAVS
jgi:hypothetical protein